MIKVQHTVGNQVLGTIRPLKYSQLERFGRLWEYGILSLGFLFILFYFSFNGLFLSRYEGLILAFIHVWFGVEVPTTSAL